MQHHDGKEHGIGDIMIMSLLDEVNLSLFGCGNAVALHVMLTRTHVWNIDAEVLDRPIANYLAVVRLIVDS